MKANKVVFDDGLRLVHFQREGVRSVAIGIMTGVGSGNENELNNGVSHFIEHMFFKGTKTRSSIDIVKEIDGMGAQINAFTSKTATCYYTFSVDENCEQCAEILSDIMFNSIFDKNELEKERKVVLEEIAMCDDDYADVSAENASTLYFGNHALARPILGMRESVGRLQREDLLDYIDKNYCAQNTVISIVGNITMDKAKRLVEKYFNRKFKSNPGRVWADESHITTGGEKYVFKPIEQANITLAFPSVPFNSPDYQTIVSGGYVFGSGMSSRLFCEVREKHGLAYSVYSYLSAYINNGMSGIYVGTNPKSAQKAVEIISKIIDDVRQNGFTEEEFKRAIQQAKSGYVLGQEGTGVLMRYYAKRLLYADEVVDVDQLMDSINKINYNDFNDLYMKEFDKKLVSMSYVGKETDKNLYNIIKG